MGATIVKEQLFDAISANNLEKTTQIIKKYPQYLNIHITNDCQSTPLGLAAFRGKLQTVDLLLNLGADINFAGPKKITPLMWACVRGHIDIVNHLIVNGADVSILCKDKLNCLEHALLFGYYSVSLYLLEKCPELEQTLQDSEFYKKLSNPRKHRFIDYQGFLEHLVKKIPFDACPDFYTKPKPLPLIDPVIDPREPWTNWFKRVLEFEQPPMVERSQLPQDLQPQNRAMGKIASIMNGKSPYPDDYYQRQKELQIKQQQEKQVQELEERQKVLEKYQVQQEKVQKKIKMQQQLSESIEKSQELILQPKESSSLKDFNEVSPQRQQDISNQQSHTEFNDQEIETKYMVASDQIVIESNLKKSNQFQQPSDEQEEEQKQE